MIGVMLKIVLICTLILLVFTLAGAGAVFFYNLIDYIIETIKGWRKK